MKGRRERRGKVEGKKEGEGERKRIEGKKEGGRRDGKRKERRRNVCIQKVSLSIPPSRFSTGTFTSSKWT